MSVIDYQRLWWDVMVRYSYSCYGYASTCCLSPSLSLSVSAVLSSFNSSQRGGERCRRLRHRLLWRGGHQGHQGNAPLSARVLGLHCSARVWYQVLDVGALTCRDVTWHVTRTQKRSRLVNAVSVLAWTRTFPNGNPKRKQNRYIAADTREHQSASVWAFVSLNYLVGLVPDEESYLKLSVCFCCVSGNISSLLH